MDYTYGPMLLLAKDITIPLFIYGVYFYTERNILGVTNSKYYICSLLVTQWEQKRWKNRLLTTK